MIICNRQLRSLIIVRKCAPCISTLGSVLAKVYPSFLALKVKVIWKFRSRYKHQVPRFIRFSNGLSVNSEWMFPLSAWVETRRQSMFIGGRSFQRREASISPVCPQEAKIIYSFQLSDCLELRWFFSLQRRWKLDKRCSSSIFVKRTYTEENKTTVIMR